MPKNKLTILFAVCMVLMASYYFMSIKSEKDASSAKIVIEPIEKIDLASIAKVSISDDKSETSMTLKDGKWIVEALSGYPANYDRIYELIYFDIMQLKPLQIVTEKEDYYEGFAVNEKGKPGAGKKITLFDKNNKPIIAIIAGQNRVGKADPGAGGQYIRIADKKAVYLIANPIELPVESSEWLNKQIADIKESDIRAIEIKQKDGKDTVELTRKNKQSPLEIASIPAGYQAKEGAVGGVSDGLANFNLLNAYANNDKAVQGIEFDSTYTAKLFNGTIYQVQTGSKEGKAYAKVGIAYETPPADLEAKKEETTSPNQDKKTEDKTQPKVNEENKASDTAIKEKDEKALKADAEKQTAFFAQWIYEIPAFNKDKLSKKLSALIEKPKAAEEKPKQDTQEPTETEENEESD